MNIGIMASSNGSVFIEIFKILNNISPKKYKFFIVLDRKTDLIDFAIENSISYTLIQEDNNQNLSIKSKDYFYKNKVDTIFLFFLRLVTKDIYQNFTTINIHPSLLPAFKGLNAIKQAINHNFKFIGATLHKVDDTIDGGQILIQTSTLINHKMNLNKISFLQKVLLMLIYFDFLETNLDLETINKCEYLSNTTYPFFNQEKYYLAFKELEEKENNKISNV